MDREGDHIEKFFFPQTSTHKLLVHVKDGKLNAKAINESQSQMLVVLLKRIYDRNDSSKNGVSKQMQ